MHKTGSKTDQDICDALRNLVPFVHFKKRERHPWRSFTLVKVTPLHECFLNCTNGAESRNASRSMFAFKCFTMIHLTEPYYELVLSSVGQYKTAFPIFRKHSINYKRKYRSGKAIDFGIFILASWYFGINLSS